jgi:hypothetical protein
MTPRPGLDILLRALTRDKTNRGRRMLLTSAFASGVITIEEHAELARQLGDERPRLADREEM